MSSGGNTKRVGALITAVLMVLIAGCAGLPHSRGWKLADLDRNWLNLANYRGVEDARTLAEGMPNADAVISAKGHAERSVADQSMPLQIVIRYDGSDETWRDIPDECFKFTFPDGYSFAFRSVDCP